MRTFPAFYVFLGCTFLFLWFVGWFEWEQLWRAPVYLENYHARTNWNDIQWFVGHSWSLAVEEQFYILIAIVFLAFYKNVYSEKTIVKIFLFILIFCPVIRGIYFLTDWLPEVLDTSVHRSFETVCDALAVGGILYVKREELFKMKWYRFFLDRPYLLFIVIFLLTTLNGSEVRKMFGYSPRFFYNIAGITIINICIAICLDSFIRNPQKDKFARFLNHRIMITIGLWSYSIYLWQQPWLFHGWESALPFRIIGLLFCSVLSYYLVELPCLRWRDKKVKQLNFN